MSRAADILRERARKSEECIAAYGLCSPAELRAVAHLMESIPQREQLRHDLVAYTCLVCRMWWFDNSPARHEPDCALAALERAITGESDAEGK